MSQPSTTFNDTLIDAFLPPMGQGDLSREQPNNGYSSTDQDHAFSPADSNIFDLDEYFDLTPSFNILTPDFTDYNISHRTNEPFSQSSYPLVPGPASPHPYPIQHHQAFHPNAQSAAHPALFRSAINTPTSSYLHPPQQQHSNHHQSYHRRSLSQSDAENITASLNPAFVRHLAPRSRPIPQQQHQTKKSKLTPSFITCNRRSTSVEPGNRARANGSSGPTSIPIETPIGTKFYMTLTGNDDARFRHMSYEEQINQSPRIIEIGAMAVINTPRSTPVHSRCTSRSCGEKDTTLLEKLDDMERKMREEMGECEKGKRGCEIIREALAEKKEENALRERMELADSESM
jgi:hypothetical protein